MIVLPFTPDSAVKKESLTSGTSRTAFYRIYQGLFFSGCECTQTAIAEINQGLQVPAGLKIRVEKQTHDRSGAKR